MQESEEKELQRVQKKEMSGKGEKRMSRWIWGSLAVLFLLMSALGGVFQVGALILLAVGILFGCTAIFQGKKGGRNRMLTICSVLVLTGIILHAAVWNYFAYCRQPAEQGEATVIVLGCKVNGDQPSLMLKRRLQKAQEYLQKNPQANCVVSGGMGENESYTEAYVMKKFLTESGIEPERIYEENRSVNTDTNIRYSLELIQKEGLSENLIVCSDGFHQLRAWLYVRRNGAQATAISGRTPFWVVPSYAIRELCGIAKMLVLG